MIVLEETTEPPFKMFEGLLLIKVRSGSISEVSVETEGLPSRGAQMYKIRL